MTDPTRPPPRDRTRSLMKKLASYAVAAALPVTNTACDPAPDPYCDVAPSRWTERVNVAATWVDAGGGDLAIDLVSTSSYPVTASPRTPTVTGGRLGTSPDASTTVRIVPDAGVTAVSASWTIDCEGYSATLHVELDLTGAATAGASVPVTPSVTEP